MLDQEVEGEVQHGQTDGIEESVHEPVSGRRQPSFVFFSIVCKIADATLIRALLYALLFGSQVEQVLVFGDLEQRLLGGAGPVRLAELDVLGLFLLAWVDHYEMIAIVS